MLGSNFIRLALRSNTLIETSANRVRSMLLRRARKVEQSAHTLPRPARELAHQAIRGTEAIERRLERRRNRLVSAILSRSWLDRWKVGELIVGYNNLGDLRFAWTTEKKEVTQRLWWVADDAEQPLHMTEYTDTLECPTWDAVPPLP